ncbi:putative acetyltransferase At3g50280 [Silene latifolia]|uniref:putative acetyltransferase At3g50280 n=1 Tax=Silene latifolia TaxID=37657 RepID=UPI003D7833D1
MGSYCEGNHKLNFISECFVKPTEVANNETYHYLGGSDLYMLSMGPIQKGLLFNSKPDNISSSFLRKLKKSLYTSLVHFYPLAGQLVTKKFDDEHKCCFYVDCNKGPGVRLIHASVDYTVPDILSSTDVHEIVNSFFDLGEKSVNYDGHTRPLLSVQLTELLDGVFIGFTINHCVADGTSLWHFISALSEIFSQLNDDQENEDNNYNQISVSKKPIFTTLFPDYGYDKIFKLPYLEPEEFIFRYDPGPLRVKLFQFSSKSIAMLKAQANEECGLHNNISSFQALCGLTWRSITRARNLKSNQDVNCVIIMNLRTRIQPPLSSEYFRSCLWAGISESNVGDLSGSGLGRAALLINQSIKMQDEKTIRIMFNHSEEHPCVVQPGPQSVNYRPYGVVVGGSAKFDVYEPEFGLGKAIAMLAGYANKDDGKVTANPGREGGGSVELEISLTPETMNALELDEEFMSFTSSST